MAKCCNTLTPLTNASFTTGLGGDGTFDTILSTVTAQFEQYYVDSRITGGDIATMVPALMEAALGASVQFLLGKDQASLQAQLLTKQLELADKDMKLKELEIQSKNLELDLMRKKVEAEIKLTYANIKLTCQKIETELSQTSDRLSNGNKVGGLIGTQVDLYEQQIVNYKRDNEQKMMKMLIDTWITRKGIDEGTELPVAIDNTRINEVVASYADAIGYDLKVTPQNRP